MGYALNHAKLTARFALTAALLSLAGCAGTKSPKLEEPETYLQEGMKSLEKKRCLEATEKFQRLVNNFPGSRLAPDAQYYLAESYFCSKDYVNAIFEYQRLVDTYPSSQWLDQAQFKIGECYYRQLRRPELDQKETQEALTYFRNFVDENPQSPLVETARQRIVDCRGRLARKQYLGGRLYQRQGFLDAASITYEEVLRNYSDTPWYYHTLLQMGEIAQARSEPEKARGYWEEVVRDSADQELQQEARKRLEGMKTAQGE
jgi:outer membrane protein assembly factor BamD